MDKYQLLHEWAKRTVNSSYSGNLSHVFTSPNVPFEQWMSENKELIEDQADDLCGVEIIENEEDFRYWFEPEDPDNPFLHVRVNTDLPKDRLIEQFQQLLKKHHPGKVGRPERLKLSDFEWCEISGKTTLETLELMMKVYDLRETTDLRLWQIAEKLKMNPSQTTKKSDTNATLVNKKAILSSTVSRYLQWANNLMKNLEEGRFPKYR